MPDEQQFLDEQRSAIVHKVQRLERLLGNCDDCLEAEGLERALHTAQIERALLNDLCKRLKAPCNGGKSCSLEAIILQQIARAQKTSDRLRHGWRRGQPTPPAYWEAEIRLTTLGQLLCQLHAWQAGRPLYADPRGSSKTAAYRPRQPKVTLPCPDNAYKHPWYLEGEEDASGAPGSNGHKSNSRKNKTRHTQLRMEALNEEVLEQLHAIDFPEEHIAVVLQEDGMTIVTGYAHSEEQRDAAIEAIIAIDGINEELSDIQVSTPDACPICHPSEEAQASKQQEETGP